MIVIYKNSSDIKENLINSYGDERFSSVLSGKCNVGTALASNRFCKWFKYFFSKCFPHTRSLSIHLLSFCNNSGARPLFCNQLMRLKNIELFFYNQITVFVFTLRGPLESKKN